MAELYYPRLKMASCEKCEVGIIEAYRKDGLPGSHLFRCPCTRPVGKSGRYPLWSEKFAIAMADWIASKAAKEKVSPSWVEFYFAVQDYKNTKEPIEHDVPLFEQDGGTTLAGDFK